MDMVSLLARIASGFAVKAAVAAFAVYVALEAYSFISAAFVPIAGVLQ